MAEKTENNDRAAYDEMHKAAFAAISLAQQILEPHVELLRKLIEAERQMHSHLHITDPTTYRSAINSENLRHQIALAKAAVRMVAEFNQVKRQTLEETPNG